MEKKRLQRAEIVDSTAFDVSSQQAEYERQQKATYLQSEKASSALKSFVTLTVVFVGSLVVFIAFLTAIIGNLHLFIDVSGAIMRILLQWVIPVLWIAVILFVGTKVLERFLKYRYEKAQLDHMEAETNAMNAEQTRLNVLNDAEIREIEARAKVLEAQADQLRATLPFDDQGNLFVWNPDRGFVQYVRGQMREFPNLTTYHNAPRLNAAQEEQKALLPGNVQRISLEDAARHVKDLELCLGTSVLNNGNPILAEIADTHLKIVGATRMGKSCLAGGILRMVELTHSPARLQFAMLDSEYKTSRLFESSSHLTTLDVKGQRARMHARTLQEVPFYLHLLARELERRDRLDTLDIEELPHILVYFEEFLNAKRQMRNQLPKQFETFVTDLNALATRGLKLGMHLMLCAQVDYADEDLTEIMAQFYGLNISFGVKPSAARAAGFTVADLLNQNYQNKAQGQFVIESFAGNDLGLAPDFDVRTKVKELEAAKRGLISEAQTIITEESRNEPETGRNEPRNESRNEQETSSDAELEQKLHEVLAFMEKYPGANSTEIKRAIWNAKQGDNEKWRKATYQYAQVSKRIQELARRGLNAGE
jgi:hypothetical protein